MEWDKIWAFNKDIIDPVVPRYTAIVDKALVVLSNGPKNNKFETHPLHPKNAAVGNKAVEYGEELYIEKADAQDIAVDEKVTLMKWGNIMVTGKNEKNGVITLKAKLLPDDKDFKKTKKDLTDKEKISNDPIKVIDHNEEPNFFSNQQFMEITPLDCQISNEMQRDLSSVPISEVELPKIVYMIVDHKIELETKILNDYPEWQFLSSSELKRKTIQIYFDLKIAKRFCNKEQKVIKVPNTNVFRIVSPILISRGISRIVSSEKLIAL